MTVQDQALQPPKGMRDFYPGEMALREHVFDAWRAAARRYGFEQYDACVVESLDLLKRKGGEEIERQIYHFQDKSGRDLALRAEMTPTLARMIAARRNELSFPIKWFCIAQCFRYERMMKGRKREHYQWNLDIAGDQSVCAEAEILAAAVCALELLGIGRSAVKIHVNNRAMVSDLLDNMRIDRTCHPAIYLALDKRGKIPDSEIAALLKGGGAADCDVEKVFALGRISSIRDAVEALGRETASTRRLAEFFDILKLYGIDDMVKFDMSVVRGLGYYTGIVFEAFDTEHTLRAIFGGGRYDNLLQDIGGEAMTAVGLGFGDVVITEFLSALQSRPALKRPNCMAVGFMEDAQRNAAIAASEFFRKQGADVDMSLKPQRAKAFFSRASEGGFKQAVYLGPDDLSKGTFRIKNLADRTEREMPLPALP